MSSILFIQCFTLPCHYCQARSNIHKKRDERKEKKRVNASHRERKETDQRLVKREGKKKERGRHKQMTEEAVYDFGCHSYFGQP